MYDDALENHNEHALIIAHRKPSLDNLLLGHVGLRLVHPDQKGNQKQHINFGHTIMPRYWPYADGIRQLQAVMHVGKNAGIASLFGVAGALTGLSDQVGVLGAATLSLSMAFGAAAWRGKDVGPGQLVIKEQDYEAYDCQHYVIPISDTQYQQILSMVREQEGAKDFALWHDNCAVLALDILTEVLGVDIPVEREFVTDRLNITTPRYVERVMHKLLFNPHTESPIAYTEAINAELKQA